MDSRLPFFGQLKRRSVFKVAAAYVVSGWLILQVSAIVLPAFALPAWVLRVVLIALVIGFPVACALAWAFEVTSEGIRRDAGPAPEADGAEREAVDDARPQGRTRAARPAGRLGSGEAVLVAAALLLALIGGLSAVWTARPEAAPHLAVLPFRVVGAEPEAEVLAAGLIESFTTTMTQFSRFDTTLWVVPSAEITASMTPSSARQRFGVSLALTGSIQFDRERVRLTLNLIDTATERQLRSRQVDVRRQSLIDLQDAATHQLAALLELRLTPRQAAVLARGQTPHPDARRLYLQGRGILRQATSVAATQAAIHRFQEALAVDPAFALAHAGLGEAYWKTYRQTEDVQWVDAAVRTSQRALAIDSTLAPVWVTLGIIRSDQGRYAEAIAALEHALALDGTHADAMRHLATVYRRQGDWPRAETTYRRAIALRPEYWKGYNLLGAFYYAQGQYDAAIAQYQRGLRLAPANPSLLNNTAVAYWQLEQLDEAMALFERILAQDSTRISAQYNLATAYFYRGRFDDAARQYGRLLARQPHDYALAGALADAQWWSASHRAAAPRTYRRAIALAKEHLAVRGRAPSVVGSLAQYHARLQQPDSARAWLGVLNTLVDSSTADVVTAFSIGELYESLGDRERAVAWMERALDRDYGWIPLSASPWLADLRTDSRIRQRLRHHEAAAPPD